MWDSDDSLVAGDDADSDAALSDADGDVTMVTPVFCQQVTAADYERQKMSASQRALHTLLDDIIRDDRMKPGDKKRHLQNVSVIVVLRLSLSLSPKKFVNKISNNAYFVFKI